MKSITVSYDSADGGRSSALKQAAEICGKDAWGLRKLGIFATDDRVLWTAEESEIVFYYRELVKCPDAS